MPMQQVPVSPWDVTVIVSHVKCNQKSTVAQRSAGLQQLSTDGKRKFFRERVPLKKTAFLPAKPRWRWELKEPGCLYSWSLLQTGEFLQTMLQQITPLYTHYATWGSPWSHYSAFYKKKHLLHGITVVYIRQIWFQLRQISNPNPPYPSFPKSREFKLWQIPKHLPAKSQRSGFTILLIALFWMNVCISHSCKEPMLFFHQRKIIAQLSIILLPLARLTLSPGWGLITDTLS